MARNCYRLSLTLALSLQAALMAWAHPVDELAQASYVGITASEITLELDLIPGEQVEAAFNTEVQQAGYPKKVEAALHLSLDGKPLSLQTVRIEKRELGQRLLLRAPLPEVTTGAHRLRYENAYSPIRSGYLAATLAGSAKVTIDRQERDPLQKSLTIDFYTRPDTAVSYYWGLLGLPLVALVALLAQRRSAGHY